jgi:hypothetical protein
VVAKTAPLPIARSTAAPPTVGAKCSEQARCCPGADLAPGHSEPSKWPERRSAARCVKNVSMSGPCAPPLLIINPQRAIADLSAEGPWRERCRLALLAEEMAERCLGAIRWQFNETAIARRDLRQFGTLVTTSRRGSLERARGGGGQGSRGWYSQEPAWPGSRRSQASEGRGNRGSRRWSCPGGNAESARPTG